MGESEETLKRLGLDSESMDATWQRALGLIRERGLDPEEVIAKAAKNLCDFRALSAEERARRIQEETSAWFAWEATVDDRGNPIELKP